MAKPHDPPKAKRDQAVVEAAARRIPCPMGFLMTDMPLFLMRAASAEPQRSQDDIEADFDNMPV